MGTVSAIVSAYYAQKYIDARLVNLESLSPRPEIIVVAQKGSVEAETAKQHDCIYILTEDIPTIYAAWNIAIRASNCDYITNANCDDKTFEYAYWVMAEYLDNDPNISLVYGANAIVENDINGNRCVTYHARPDHAPDWLAALQKACFVGPMPMWRKSLHDKYGYFNPSYTSAGDYEFWLWIAKCGEQFKCLDVLIGKYTRRPDSLEFRDVRLSRIEAAKIRKLYGG